MEPLPPIVADFQINSLELSFRDARTCSAEDNLISAERGANQARDLMSAQPADKRAVLCDDDPSIEEYWDTEAQRVWREGTRHTKAEMIEAGFGLKNDVCPDPRYPDMRFNAYSDSGTLVGAFVVLKIRHRSLQDGVMRAQGTPWPQFLVWRGMVVRVLWPALMNYFLDNDLPFLRERGSLDIVEWKFPIDDPRFSFFPIRENDPYGVVGMRSLVTLGRDEVRNADDTMTQFIRRGGEQF